MELERIKLDTTWNDAAERLNRNNLKVAMELTKLQNATYKNKGYFPTAESLASAYPSASLGSIAYVGETFPYLVYAWNPESGEWENTGMSGGDGNVELGDYYTKDETHQAIKDEYVVMPQSVYDALETKEDKLYFCTED